MENEILNYNASVAAKFSYFISLLYSLPLLINSSDHLSFVSPLSLSHHKLIYTYMHAFLRGLTVSC